MPTADLSEREWLAGLERRPPAGTCRWTICARFSQIRASARALEEAARVAYLGPEGSFCHATAKRHFGSSGVYAECATLAEALEEVERGRALYAVFPYESSTDGLVVSNIATLEATDLVLVAERTTTAAYDLMSRTANMADIEKSTPRRRPTPRASASWSASCPRPR